jgi:hypothetical protein
VISTNGSKRSGIGAGRLIVLALLALVVTPVQAHHRDKFELIGTATFDKDPTDPSNYVVKVDNTAGFGGVRRVLNAKITELDDHLTVRYYFVGPKSCRGGSPRIQLRIDANSDGILVGNAFGTIGPSPLFTGCRMNEWVTEDVTISALEGGQAVGRWDASQLGCGNFVPWDIVKACIATVYPNHTVLTATLIEDQAVVIGTFQVLGGVTYYDDITLGYRTLEDQSDVSGNN